MQNRTLYTALISLVVALGGFLLGFDSAVIAGAVPFIREFFGLSDLALGWSVSCLIFGAMAGNALAGPAADRFGRKPVLIVTAVLFTASALTSALAQALWFFVAARILGGVAVGGAILIAPIYIAEIAPPHRRGFLVSFNQLNIVIGISAAFFSNYFLLHTGVNNWRWMLGVEAVPAILYFLLLFLVPRSPRWLAQRGNDAQALEVMEKVGGRNYAEESLKTIKEHLHTVVEKTHISALFTRKMRFIMAIAFAIAFFQQITGINAILYYAPMIFAKTGGGTEVAFSQAVAVGLVNFGFTIVAMWLIDKLGRKPLLLIGTVVMALAYFINATAFFSADYQLTEKSFAVLEKAKSIGLFKREVPAQVLDDLKALENTSFPTEDAFAAAVEDTIGEEAFEEYEKVIIDSGLNVNSTIVLLAILGFIAAFAISLGPVMWALLSEIFPNQLRGLAISAVGFFNSLVSFTVTFVFPWEMATLGPAVTFLIYGIFAAAAFIFVVRYIPETKGKSLEELESQLLVKD